MVYTIPFCNQPGKAFTLAELLIALVILGVIATFTIPKVLVAQQQQQYRAVYLEDVSSLAQAMSNYRVKTAFTATTGNLDMTPYLNYVAVSSTGQQIDHEYWDIGPISCDGGSYICLQMHNGSRIAVPNGDQFGGTSPTNALVFLIDPDGKVTDAGSPANGNGKATATYFYFSGRVKSRGTCDPGTTSLWDTPSCPAPGADPPYVGWAY